jgi:hypothetical protein
LFVCLFVCFFKLAKFNWIAKFSRTSYKLPNSLRFLMDDCHFSSSPRNSPNKKDITIWNWELYHPMKKSVIS